MNGVSIALKFSSLIAGAGLFLILFKKVDGLKTYGLSGILYVGGLSIILSLSTLLLLFNTSLRSESSYLIGGQLYIVVIGILHVIFSRDLIPWYTKQVLPVQIIIILCILLFTQFLCGLSFSYLVDSSIPIIWYFSLLGFFIPVLLHQSINRLLEVPPKEYKSWEFPVDTSIDGPTAKEMENPVIISFIFRKTENSKEYTTFKAKAPVGMQLGRLFYFFINDYNSQHPESNISYVDDTNKSLTWVFFKVKNKFFRLKEALDPDDSIYNNEIRENDVLVCSRVKE